MLRFLLFAIKNMMTGELAFCYTYFASVEKEMGMKEKKKVWEQALSSCSYYRSPLLHMSVEIVREEHVTIVDIVTSIDNLW